jgi:hypothetical protein
LQGEVVFTKEEHRLRGRSSSQKEFVFRNEAVSREEAVIKEVVDAKKGSI